MQTRVTNCFTFPSIITGNFEICFRLCLAKVLFSRNFHMRPPHLGFQIKAGLALIYCSQGMGTSFTWHTCCGVSLELFSWSYDLGTTYIALFISKWFACDEKLDPVESLFRVHGRNGVSDIKSFTANTVHTTGRDGFFRVYKVTRNGANRSGH